MITSLIVWNGWTILNPNSLMQVIIQCYLSSNQRSQGLLAQQMIQEVLNPKIFSIRVTQSSILCLHVDQITDGRMCLNIQTLKVAFPVQSASLMTIAIHYLMKSLVEISHYNHRPLSSLPSHRFCRPFML